MTAERAEEDTVAYTVEGGIAWVKFVGTHARYDTIDVETVNEY